MDHNQSTVLAKPQTEPRSLLQIKELVEQGIIDLSPEYQRNVVWTSTKQAYLIDSLRNHYYVPPLIFALRTDENGRWKLNVVDGKQRITSILKFYNNLVPSRPPKESLAPQISMFYSKTPTQGRCVLSPEEQKRFDNLDIICIQYIGLTNLQERELFQRMQMGMNLTNPEKLHAVDSSMNDLVVKIQERFTVLKSMFADNRMRATMVIAQVLCMIFENNYQKIPAADYTSRFLRESELQENDERKALRIFFRYAALISSFPQVFDRHVSPIEFIFLALMIHKRQQLPNTQLLVMFRNCYRHVRERHPGQVRANNAVLKTLNDYVESGEADISTAEMQGDTQRSVNPSPSNFQTRANNTSVLIKSEPELSPLDDLYQGFVEQKQEWDEPFRMNAGPSNTRLTIRQDPIISQRAPIDGRGQTISNQEDNVVVVSDDDDDDSATIPSTSISVGTGAMHQQLIPSNPTVPPMCTSASRDTQFLMPLARFPADANNFRLVIPPPLVPSKRPIEEPSLLAKDAFELCRPLQWM